MEPNTHGKPLKQETLVDHFRIMRLIGRGSIAEVYLARDTKLGRRVALKLIRPEALGPAEALERFLYEARATSRFEHPHIVTGFAVGDYQGRPYVALEYLQGSSLRGRMAEGPFGVLEAVRICRAVADGLKVAHAAGILHRDLKPENVMLAGDGRVRLMDFGLAAQHPAPKMETGDPGPPEPVEEPLTSGVVFGSPAYMAPEQWREETLSGATDVWAVGVMLYEMLAGRRPYEQPSADKQARQVCSQEPAPAVPSERKVPPVLRELMARCLQKDPSDRPVAAALVELLAAVLTTGGPRASSAEGPFRGLLPFEEKHSHLFFGRGIQVGTFLERMRSQTVLPVVGPSGAGKSSFVQAGVIPRLRERSGLVLLSMRPGAAPFDVLATGIVAARHATTPDITAPNQVAGLSEEEQLARQLRASPQLLNLALLRLAKQHKAQVVLFVDQLEELWALLPDGEQRRAFLVSLATAADDPNEPVRVVFTLREDFLSRLGEAPGVDAVLGRITVLGRMGTDQLIEVLTRSVEAVGYEYDDPRLVGDMVAEAQGEDVCLPLLQFAGQILWEQRDTLDKRLRRSVYDDAGGVAHALNRYADGVIGRLGEGEENLARAILLRLVTAEDVGRVSERGELLQGLESGADRVLKKLVDAGLVVRTQVEDDERVELEMVHDALVRAWSRLQRWMHASREDSRFLLMLDRAARLWDESGRRPDETWRGQQLQDAERVVESSGKQPAALIAQFVDAGRARRRRNAIGRRVLWTLLGVCLAGGGLLLGLLWSGSLAGT